MKKIVFCILCLLLLCTPQNVYARAGGGGGGGGGSGGGGSSSHSGGSGYPHRRTSLLESLVVQGGFFIMAGAGGILFAVHLHKKKRTSARMLKKMRKCLTSVSKMYILRCSRHGAIWTVTP